MREKTQKHIESQPSPGGPGLTVYRVSISRHKLKKGDHRADRTEVSERNGPDESFYDPAVALLDRICRESGGDEY